MPDIITPLDACVDMILWGNVVPAFGQVEQLVDGYRLEVGGSAGIFACQCARLGLSTAVVGRTGPDAFGQLIRRRFAEFGVDLRHLAEDPHEMTGVGVALCQENDRAILTYPGTIDVLTGAEFPDSIFDGVRHLHIASYFLLTRLRPAVPDLLRRARAAGLTTSLDTNWDPDNRWEGVRELLPLVDIFLPNAQELMAITGCDTLEAAMDAAAGLVPHLVVKDGAEGAYYRGEWGAYRAASYPAPFVADAIGAGDSFNGGFVTGFLRGLPAETCLQMGCAAGSLNVRAPGGVAGQGDMEAISAVMHG